MAEFSKFKMAATTQYKHKDQVQHQVLYGPSKSNHYSSTSTSIKYYTKYEHSTRTHYLGKA